MGIRSSDIDVMQKLIGRFGEEYEPVLNMFSEYISANPNFKYVPTYLTDSIAVFSTQIRALITRKSEYMSKREDIISKYIPNSLRYSAVWVLILDNVFVISNCFEEEIKTITDLVDKAPGNTRMSSDMLKLLNFHNSFSLYKFDVKTEKVVLLLRNSPKDNIVEYTWCREAGLYAK